MARTVVVSGSASGIGAATAAAARAAGDTVIGIDLDDADVCADLSTVDGRASIPDAVRSHSGGTVDAVIACAGVSAGSAVAVNYFGTLATLAGLRPLLLRSSAPRAVVVSSSSCIHHTDDATIEACLAGDEGHALARAAEIEDPLLTYASSKAALCRWVRRAAPTEDWAGAGIPLNAISPGTVLTPMTEPLLSNPDTKALVDSVVPMPLNGYARPETLAAALLWLAGPANTHITGQNVFVDGGADAVLRGDSTW